MKKLKIFAILEILNIDNIKNINQRKNRFFQKHEKKFDYFLILYIK